MISLITIATLLIPIIAAPLIYFVTFKERLFIGYLVLTFLPFFYLAWKQNNWQLNLRLCWEACFPKAVWKHASSRVDIGFFLINTVWFTALLLPFLQGSNQIALFTEQALISLFGTAEAAEPGSVNVVAVIGMTLVLALLADFAVYLAHYLQHKIPFLWEFHKVHHSAEVLNPLTAYRMHPLDDLLAVLLIATFIGGTRGIFHYIYQEEPMIMMVAGMNICTFLFYLLFYNLRHSHIWLHYPGEWGKLFVSPAMHQLHHSSEQRHWDKNFGFIFGMWDWMFGTLYLPKDKESFAYGIGEETTEYHTVWRLYLLPFQKNWQRLKQKTDSVSKKIISLWLICGFICSYAGQAVAWTPPSVWLNDLTSPEVAKAVDQGYTSILIPTAGTEQNGEHLVLGKHHYVIRYTAEKIAGQHGRMLIAPVMDYVPEATHMEFVGTISLSEETFAAVLEDTAESLKQHGFKAIYFMGDSYGNQAIQKEIAEELAEDFAEDGVMIASLNAYYDANRQVDMLKAQGFKDSDIGGHAGIRDTSELMVANSQGVRQDNIRDNTVEEGNGANGKATYASDEIGKQMLKLKIDAALRQIRLYEEKARNSIH